MMTFVFSEMSGYNKTYEITVHVWGLGQTVFRHYVYKYDFDFVDHK